MMMTKIELAGFAILKTIENSSFQSGIFHFWFYGASKGNMCLIRIHGYYTTAATL